MEHFEVKPGTFNFLPPRVDPKPVATMEECALLELFEIGGIRYDMRSESTETKRRIVAQLDRIRCADWGGNQELYPFNAESLITLTAYIDAMPKFRLGYRYCEVLKREATMLIPVPVIHPIDVNELLVPFIRWRRNACEIENRFLIVGLFLLFFYALKRNCKSTAILRYDKIVDAIMKCPEPDITPNIKKIIQEGIYASDTYIQ